MGCCAGDRVDSIDFWSMRVRDLEQRITIARQAALDNPPTTSYFVFFSNQKDAAIAAQTNLHAEDGHSFRVMEAPGPEEVGFCCVLAAEVGYCCVLAEEVGFCCVLAAEVGFCCVIAEQS